MPGLLKAEIFASARKPESASINAYIYSMLNFLKSVTFFEKNKIFFLQPRLHEAQCAIRHYLRRLCRLPASPPTLPEISRCKARRELKYPRFGNTHIPSYTLAYAGAGRLLPLLLRRLFISYLSNMQDFLFFVMFFTIFFIFFYTKKNLRAKRGD